MRVHSVAAEERSKTEEGDEGEPLEEEGGEEEEEEARKFMGRHSRSSPPAGPPILTSLSATGDPGLPESPSRKVSSCLRFSRALTEVGGASRAPKRESSMDGAGVAAIILEGEGKKGGRGEVE